MAVSESTLSMKARKLGHLFSIPTCCGLGVPFLSSCIQVHLRSEADEEYMEEMGRTPQLRGESLSLNGDRTKGGPTSLGIRPDLCLVES